MKYRRSSIVLAAVGAPLLVVAALIRPVVVPWATLMPEDTDETVHYRGTMSSLDREAVAAGDATHALARDLPATMDRRVRVLRTHGDVAIVQDTTTVRTVRTTLPRTRVYALRRDTLRATRAPAGETVLPATGLTVAFPIGPKADDRYTYWDATTRLNRPIIFKGTEHRRGRTVNVYEIAITGPVREESVLANLPPALPAPLLRPLAPLLAPGAAGRLDALPAVVPLAYEATTTITAYIDRETGFGIDQHFHQTITATTTLNATPTALLPVLTLDLAVTPGSGRHLADRAHSAATRLLLLRVVAPSATLAIALALLTVATLRRRPRPAPDGS